MNLFVFCAKNKIHIERGINATQLQVGEFMYVAASDFKDLIVPLPPELGKAHKIPECMS